MGLNQVLYRFEPVDNFFLGYLLFIILIRLVEIINSLTIDNDCKILIYSKDKEKCLNLNYELKRHLDIEILDFRKEEHRKYMLLFILELYLSNKIKLVASVCEHSKLYTDHF